MTSGSTRHARGDPQRAARDRQRDVAAAAHVVQHDDLRGPRLLLRHARRRRTAARRRTPAASRTSSPTSAWSSATASRDTAPDGFAPGDVILTNHQRVAGQHLNNIVIYTPIFAGGELFGFAATRAHWVDVGGLSTGFGAGNARPTRGWRACSSIRSSCGRPASWTRRRRADHQGQHPLSRNRRWATCVAGRGLPAGRAAAGGDRTTATARPSSRTRSSAIFDQTEARCRRAVAAIPDGVYQAESCSTATRASTEPMLIKVKVTIAGGEMEIDLSGARRSATGRSTRARSRRRWWRTRRSPRRSTPVNEGAFRARRGRDPGRQLHDGRVPGADGVLGPDLPTRGRHHLPRARADICPTACRRAPRRPRRHASCSSASIRRPARGSCRRASKAAGGADGRSATASRRRSRSARATCTTRRSRRWSSSCRCWWSSALRRDSGGAGLYRGGLGVSVRLRSLAEGRWNLRQSRRRSLPAWGLEGGSDGGGSDNLIRRPDEDEFSSVDAAHVQAPCGHRGDPDQRGRRRVGLPAGA